MCRAVPSSIYALECFEMIVPSQSPKFMHETHDTGTAKSSKNNYVFDDDDSLRCLYHTYFVRFCTVKAAFLKVTLWVMAPINRTDGLSV